MTSYRPLFLILISSLMLSRGLTMDSVDHKLDVLKENIFNVMEQYPGKQLVPLKELYNSFEPPTQNTLGKMLVEGFALSLTRDNPDRELTGLVHDLQNKQASIQAEVVSDFLLKFYDFFLDFYLSNSDLEIGSDEFLEISGTFEDFQLKSGVNVDYLIKYSRNHSNNSIEGLINLFKEVQVQTDDTNFKGVKLILDLLLKQKFHTDYYKILNGLLSTLEINDEGNLLFIDVMNIVYENNYAKMMQLLSELAKKPESSYRAKYIDPNRLVFEDRSITTDSSEDLQPTLPNMVQNIINPINELLSALKISHTISGFINDHGEDGEKGRSSPVNIMPEIFKGLLDIPMAIWTDCPTEYICLLRSKSTIRWYMAKYGLVALGIPFKYALKDYNKAIPAILAILTEDECDKHSRGICKLTIPNVS